MPHANDLTDLVAAACSNEFPILSAFRDRFPRSRFHLPLAALVGVKNRPETAVELGPRLPAHRLHLDNGSTAIPIFTRVGLCRDCADRLSWKTDGKTIKTLVVPGTTALDYLQELMADSEIERVIVNPLSDGVLHLARTDVEAIAQGKHMPSLWFYSKAGRLKRSVQVAVSSSLLSSILTRADRILQKLTEDSGGSEILELGEVKEVLEGLPVDGPLSGLASELFALVSAEKVDTLELVLTKSGNDVRVEATPPQSARLLGRIRALAEKHLSASDETNVKLTVRGASIVVSSSSSARVEKTETARPPAPAPEFTYIPLEPEPLPED